MTTDRSTLSRRLPRSAAPAGRLGWRRVVDWLPRRPRRDRPWGLLAGLVLALGCLAGGVFLPTLSVETFPLIEDSVSVWQGLGVLWDDDQYLLFAVLLVFSLLFPTAKLAVALVVAWRLNERPPQAVRPGAVRPGAKRLVAAMDGLAKWSMLDVLVIAIIVAALNLTVISGVEVHPGLYLFTLSVVLSKVLIGRLSARLRRNP